MDKDKVLLTKSGVEKLEEERDNLINVERPRVIEELQLARSQGDLSENADYDAARDKQAQIEQRIKEIEYMLQNAEIISEEQMDLNVVKPGTTVTILDLSLDDPKEEKYTIVEISTKVNIITPGLNRVLGNPYIVKVERKIPNVEDKQ